MGDHIRKRRLDLGLYQSDVARLIGTEENSIYNWENNRGNPRLYLIPKIIKFLCYDPFPAQGNALSDRIKAYRRVQGINRRKLAKELGIDVTTLDRWENNKSKPSDKLMKRLEIKLSK